MNQKVRKLLALALAAIVTLGTVEMAAAEGVTTPSDLPPVPSAAPTVSEESAVTAEPTAMPEQSAEPTAVPDGTEAPTEALIVEAEPTATPEATVEPTPEPTAAPEATEEPIVEAEPTATPEAAEAPAAPETVDVVATIVWEDNGNAKGIRPDIVPVIVTGSDGSEYHDGAKDRPLPGETGHVRHDVWTQEFRGLPRMAGDAVIEYRVSVTIPQGYRLQLDGMTIHLYVNETEATEAPAEPVITPEPTEVGTAEPEIPAEPTEEPAPEQTWTVTVNADTDIRAAADGLSEIILTIPAGTTVAVLGAEGDWLRVDASGVIGYIYKDSVDAWDGAEPETPDEECPIAVTIFSSRRAVMEPGETVELTSKIEGSEGYEIMLQWQCDKGDGFADVPGANEDHYSFAASIETLSYSWRLVVYYR